MASRQRCYPRVLLGKFAPVWETTFGAKATIICPSTVHYHPLSIVEETLGLVNVWMVVSKRSRDGGWGTEAVVDAVGDHGSYLVRCRAENTMQGASIGSRSRMRWKRVKFRVLRDSACHSKLSHE